MAKGELDSMGSQWKGQAFGEGCAIPRKRPPTYPYLWSFREGAHKRHHICL